MTRVFSGIKPTGPVQLGNLLGALRHWVSDQDDADTVFCVVDLHALTVPQDPTELRSRTLELAQLLLAIGIDPDRSTLFVQSHVPEHTELSWLLECTASFGELRRMTQFKDKSDDADFVSAGLFTYPALMAADILLYDTDRVPVGDDQRQHLELARDLAIRFNHRYGDTFVVPEATIPAIGARVMDLQHPTRKMSKSDDSPQGTILVLDPLDVVAKKITRAVTDAETEVRFDPVAKPGVSNLLSILGACLGVEPTAVADRYTRYGDLKKACAEAVVETLRPIQERYAELAADPEGTASVLAMGAAKARDVAAPTLDSGPPEPGAAPGGLSTGPTAVAPRRRQSSSASWSASAISRGMVHCSAGRWCSLAQATVSGSLPASASRSPPSSGWRRYSPTRRVKPPARHQARITSSSRPIMAPESVAATRP